MKKTPLLPVQLDHDATGRKLTVRPPVLHRKTRSVTPVTIRQRSPLPRNKVERRCQSQSPSMDKPKRSIHLITSPYINSSSPEAVQQNISFNISSNSRDLGAEKEVVLPQCVLTKLMRSLASKRREFMKLRKNMIAQQKSFIENYAAVRDLETKVGVSTSESVGDVRLTSVTGWPAYDLLLLVRDDIQMSLNGEIGGMLGSQILQQLHAQLGCIPEEVMAMAAELMASRMNLLNTVSRGKQRNDRDRSNYHNLESKTKNEQFEQETERLHRYVIETVENLKAKTDTVLHIVKIPWIDRDTLVKKLERSQKEIYVLQNKLEDVVNKENEISSELGPVKCSSNYQKVVEELAKEQAAREALKQVVSSAENMLRVARARISTLEKQLKESRAELETAHRKQKDLEQINRHRESSYDARSKKLIEVSKHGEVTIEALSRQRDALEFRVKELREQAEIVERAAAVREAAQRSCAESLQAKVAEQEKAKLAAEAHIHELEGQIKNLEDHLQTLKDRSAKLVELEHSRCLELIPCKEMEPSHRETQIWKELQVTRLSLCRAEEELRQSKADKDNFLNTLSRIAQSKGTDELKDKFGAELVDREQKIIKLQNVIQEQRENEKIMEHTMTEYENQLASLRLEIKRLRNYDCYSKEVSNHELQTELLELHMQVETLTRERSALVNAAASRALMLERHERAADLFTRVVRARRELSAQLEGRSDVPVFDENSNMEVSRSLSSVCANAAETWTALRAERARVLRLESAVLEQSHQLERESHVRTQLEWRRASLEREIIRLQQTVPMEPVLRNPRLKTHYGHNGQGFFNFHDMFYSHSM